MCLQAINSSEEDCGALHALFQRSTLLIVCVQLTHACTEKQEARDEMTQHVLTYIFETTHNEKLQYQGRAVYTFCTGD